MLKEFLIEKIRKSGPISFHNYMEDCLYHPELGYYTTEKVRIGKRGDFFTNPHVSALFGWTLAHWYSLHFSSTSQWMVLELGGGEGYLALDFLSFLWQTYPDLLLQTRYAILERSLPLAERQKDALSLKLPLDVLQRVVWYSEVTQIPSFQGLVLSNEFFDAFPVRRYIFRRGKFLEIFVDWNGSAFVEILREPECFLCVEFLKEYRTIFQEGQEVETAEDIVGFLDLLLPRMTAGHFLTLDYGAEAKDLFQRYPRGTVLAHRKHQVSENLYGAPGEEDLSAFVNFTVLRRRLEHFQFRVDALQPQALFLVEAGIFQVFENRKPSLPGPRQTSFHLGLKTLLNPEGMGTTFQALHGVKASSA